MIRFGTAGWQYRDWEGIVYPKPQPRGFDPLSFLAGFFDVVEINSSFYGPPINGGAKIDHETPRKRRFAAVQKLTSLIQLHQNIRS